ncbi:MAG: hypothetical protein ABEI06_10105 [Halobacteriaceae archaeon]
MLRRKILQATGIALGTTIAGCLNSTVAGRDATTTIPQATRDTETKNTNNTSAGTVGIKLSIDNQTNTRHSGTITITHIMDPACLYANPSCKAPSKQNTALDQSFTVEAGEQKDFPSISLDIESDDYWVNFYTIEVKMDSNIAQLSGLEAGGAAIIGRKRAGKYPWRVTDQDYRIQAVFTGSDLQFYAVSPLDLNKTPPGNPCIEDPQNCTES